MASVTATAVSAGSVSVEWTPPSNPNGPAVSYRLEVRQIEPEVLAPVPLVLDAETALQHLHLGLKPYSVYEYRVSVANSAGTTETAWVPVRTCAAAPEGLSPPVLDAVSSTALRVSWSPPSAINGPPASLVYTLAAGASGSPGRTLLSNTRRSSFVWQYLEPFTVYQASMAACVANTCGTGQLCVNVDEPSTGRTAEAPPQGLLPPAATVLGSRAAAVRWLEPARPNGENIDYFLYRNGVLVYSGGLLATTDDDLTPGTAYVYYVIARNGAGEVVSSNSDPVSTFLTAPQVGTATRRGLRPVFDPFVRALHPCRWPRLLVAPCLGHSPPRAAAAPRRVTRALRRRAWTWSPPARCARAGPRPPFRARRLPDTSSW